MKKILCALLIISMLIPVIPVMAAGDTTSSASNAYFKVGNGYYSTLKGALADAPSAGDATVYLLKDVSLSEYELTVPAGADVTIDLGGHTITATNTSKYFIEPIKGKLTLKNGKINVNRGLVVGGGGVLTVDNVDITVTNTTSNARPAVKLSGKGNTVLNVKDSHLKTLGPGESLVLVEFSTDGVINLEGDSVLEYAGVLDSEAQNCGAIAVQQNWGTNVDSTAATSNTDLVLNMGANAKIVNTAPSDTASNTGAAIVLSTKGNVTLNLEKGATIAIDRVAGKSKSYHINRTSYTGSLKINDKGANWQATAKTLSEGSIYFPDFWVDGSSVLGWTDGTSLVKTGVPYSVKGASSAVNFSPVCYKSGGFDIVNGAAVRTVQDQRAIRFTTVVTPELVSLLGKGVSFGTVVAEGYTNPTRSENKTDIKANRFVPQSDGNYIYYAALFLDDELSDADAYKKTYAAVSYMKVNYSDGSAKYFYTGFDYNNVRSMIDVACNLETANYKNSVVDYILSFFSEEDIKPQNKDALLIGYCTEGSLYDGAFNSSVGWYAAGMGYIIKTSDGKLIAIDGGNTEDAEGFYNLLREYSNTEKVTVDYWILTHPHGDHVNSLLTISRTPELANNLVIKNLVYHFPTDWNDSSSKTYNAHMTNIAAQFGANVINPTEGQVINVGTAKVTFLYVAANYKSYTTANKISLIFTVESNKKIMFTGDIYNEGLQYAYNKYGENLKCDILQMPHHFLCDTGYQPFYEAADASAIMLPTCIAGYIAMYNDSSYKDSAKHKANDWAAQNADTVYRAFDGTFEIVI